MVFKARQLKPKRLVALKMVLGGQLASKEAVDRFYAEVQAAGGGRFDTSSLITRLG